MAIDQPDGSTGESLWAAVTYDEVVVVAQGTRTSVGDLTRSIAATRLALASDCSRWTTPLTMSVPMAPRMATTMIAMSADDSRTSINVSPASELSACGRRGTVITHSPGGR